MKHNLSALIASRRKYLLLPGTQFARWTVLEYRGHGAKDRGMYLCRCVCGTEKLCRREMLVSGDSKSCGCWKRELHRKKICLPSGRAVRNDILSRYKRNAAVWGREWSLTDSQFDKLILLPCHYCGVEHGNYKESPNKTGGLAYNGLDRKDSGKGYTLENVVPCCAICNRAKSDSPYEEFLAWLGRVARRPVGGL